MAQLIRPLCLRLWPRLQRQCCSTSSINHLASSLSASRRRSFPTAALSPSGPLGPRIAYGTIPEEVAGKNGSDSDSEGRASRNQRKREARRAVQWGMDMASFTNSQIKFILSVTSMEPEVLEAIMLVRRLGGDVREGRRRQFNYIGKLLRDAEPTLMDELINATKVGDLKRLKELAASVPKIQVDDKVEDDEEDKDSEYEELEEHISVATRWFDGLVSKDVEVTNEVYSLRNVEFDRQELRTLIRNVHSAQEQKAKVVEGSKRKLKKAVATAEKILKTFLVDLAKQIPIDEIED